MPAVHQTVATFTERYLTTDEDGSVSLETAWEEYNTRYPGGVPRERFRWHLEKSLPESPTVERSSGEIRYDGVCLERVR